MKRKGFPVPVLPDNAPLTPPEHPTVSSLAELRHHVRLHSPFASNRVSSLADAHVHVPAIHQSAWNQLVHSAEQARQRERGGLGVVVWGDPGVGKSHLLTRFGDSVEVDHRGQFLLLHNILCAPRLIPQYLLKCVLGHLVPVSQDRRATPLYSMVLDALRQAISESGKAPRKPLSINEAWNLFRTYGESMVMPRLPAMAREDARDIWRVLFQFYSAVYRGHYQTDRSLRNTCHTRSQLALRALRGEPLERSESAELGIQPVVTTDAREPNDQWIEAVLLVLLELARIRGTLLVVCFDQVENLSDERFIELMRFNHALLDHGRNLLIVIGGVRTDLIGFRTKELVPPAAWDRVAQQRVDLFYVAPADVRQLLAARLQDYFQPFTHIAALRRAVAQDPLFPLGNAWLEQRLGTLAEVRPRDALSWAHQRWCEQSECFPGTADDPWWSQWQNQPTVSPGEIQIDWQSAMDARIEQKVAEHMQRRQLQPGALPPDASNLCGLVAAVLQQCVARAEQYHLTQLEMLESEPASRWPYDLEITYTGHSDGPMRIGIAVLVTQNATTAAAAYRRILHDPAPPDRIVLVEDERQPVPLGAKGREYREALEARGARKFCVLTLTFPQLALLDALVAVRAEAHSGDLEITQADGQSTPITATQVEDSHHRRLRYRHHVLLQTLLDEPAGSNGQLDRAERPPAELTDEQLTEFILGHLEVAAGASSNELAHRLGQLHGLPSSADVEPLRRRLENIAQQLHATNKLNASPTSKDLYLLLKP